MILESSFDNLVEQAQTIAIISKIYYKVMTTQLNIWLYSEYLIIWCSSKLLLIIKPIVCSLNLLFISKTFILFFN